MLDPFPPCPRPLSKAVAPLASFFNLSTLPLHAHEALLACAFYTYLYLSLSPKLSKKLIPDIYARFNARTRINWNAHVVAFVQSVVVCTVSLWILYKDEERADLDWKGRVWGYTGATGLIQALALGYFLWDLVMCARHVKIFGPGMLAHGLSAVSVFSLGFRPFVNFYAPTFILYELSSPFLNLHWALDKLNLTGSIYQLINGIFLITTFACCRLLWGTYQSVLVFMDVWTALSSPGTHVVLAAPFAEEVALIPSTSSKEEVMRFAGDAVVPLWLAATYLGSNLCLNGLNWFWFMKMIQTIRKRFEPGAKERGLKVKGEGDAGVLANGGPPVKGKGTGAEVLRDGVRGRKL